MQDVKQARGVYLFLMPASNCLQDKHVQGFMHKCISLCPYVPLI